MRVLVYNIYEMLECKTCEHNAEITRENCWWCLDKEQSRFLSEKNWDSEVCSWCQYLWKELEDKTEVCSDCIFSILNKQNGNN